MHASAQASASFDSLVVLPTHPLRALWFAGHGSLLAHWSRALEEIEPPKRKQRIQLDLLATIAAVNVPAFAHHPDVDEPHVFFRNLDAGHGVAFPAGTADPALKLADLAKLVGLAAAPSLAEGEQGERAAETIARFHVAHPYADPFRIALINPDDGSFAGEAIGAWAKMIERDHRARLNLEQDDEDPPELPRLTLTAYVADRRASLRGLADQRRVSEESSTHEPSDHLQPALAVVMQPVARLQTPAAVSRRTISIISR